METGYGYVMLCALATALCLNWQVASKMNTRSTLKGIFLRIMHIFAGIGYSFPVLLFLESFNNNIDAGSHWNKQTHFIGTLYSDSLLLPGYIFIGALLLLCTLLISFDTQTATPRYIGRDLKDIGMLFGSIAAHGSPKKDEESLENVYGAGAFLLAILLLAPFSGFFVSNTLTKLFQRVHQSA